MDPITYAQARGLLRDRSMKRLAFVLLLLPVAGCELYFGDDDCTSGGAAEPFPGPGLRNPWTGQCEWQNPPSECGPVPANEDRAPVAQPTWGVCGSPCEAYDEA